MIEWQVVLHHDPSQWKDKPVGFGLDDPDYDPAFDGAAVPPPGFENLPWDRGGGVDGE